MIVNTFITEISEEDFRKLGLKGYEQVWEKKFDTENDGSCSVTHHLVWKEVDLNKVLDENIAYWQDQGFQKDFEDLKYPVTIAIHTKNGPNPTDYYFDKFMNRYSGPKTYALAMGLKHIYSTRDYFEARDDYWRVLKRETKAIYRIHLSEKYLKEFKLKHKTEHSDPLKDSYGDMWHYIEYNYNLDEKTDKWELGSIVEVRKSPENCSYTPITKEKEQELIDKIGFYKVE